MKKRDLGLFLCQEDDFTIPDDHGAVLQVCMEGKGCLPGTKLLLTLPVSTCDKVYVRSSLKNCLFAVPLSCIFWLGR